MAAIKTCRNVSFDSADILSRRLPDAAVAK